VNQEQSIHKTNYQSTYYRNNRARRLRCYLMPRSPTMVLYPSGKVMMKSCALASIPALITSSIEAGGCWEAGSAADREYLDVNRSSERVKDSKR
jgi:hypothetical protein